MSTEPRPPDQWEQADIDRKLQKLPPTVLEGFQRAREALSSAFNDEESMLWASEGITIASQTVRAWEAGVEYFKASPEVAKYLPFAGFHAMGEMRYIPLSGLPHAGAILL